MCSCLLGYRCCCDVSPKRARLGWYFDATLAMFSLSPIPWFKSGSNASTLQQPGFLIHNLNYQVHETWKLILYKKNIWPNLTKYLSWSVFSKGQFCHPPLSTVVAACMRLSVCLCVRVCIIPWLVHAINLYPFKLEYSLDHKIENTCYVHTIMG